MKKIAYILASSCLLAACNNNPKDQQNEQQENTVASPTDSLPPSQESKPIGTVNTENIPLTTSDIGDFPFFTLPKGIKEMNKPLLSQFDVCFFPVEGIMTPFEGKLYKANINAEPGQQFSQHYFEKSMADYLESIGAVKVFDGEITQEEYDRYNKQDPHKGDEGDIGYAGTNIKFWMIRTAEKGNIYIQYSSNNASAHLNVLQEEAFEQTITKVTADKIAKDLSEKGKSILYINFDTDKSELTTTGTQVVEQISEALKEQSNLKISIEGHTDNTGNPSHNKELSEQRAQAVLEALTKMGIESSRLSAAGFGAEKPLVANDSEDNKAKNRRVELVKTN